MVKRIQLTPRSHPVITSLQCWGHCPPGLVYSPFTLRPGLSHSLYPLKIRSFSSGVPEATISEFSLEIRSVRGTSLSFQLYCPVFSRTVGPVQNPLLGKDPGCEPPTSPRDGSSLREPRPGISHSLESAPNEERGLALTEPTACGCTRPSAPALMVSGDVVEETQTKGQEV